MNWDQYVIFAAMIPAVYLLSKQNRWGNPIGLLAQPAYFYTTWANDQWGMFALTAWFTWCFAKGTYDNFRSKT